MREYVLAIAGVVLVSAVISIIAPSGKMGKFIKGATRLAVLVILVSPFANVLSGGEFSFSSEQIAEDSAYLRRCADLLSEEDEKNIAKFMQTEFGVAGEADVIRNGNQNYAYEKITIKIYDFGIFGEDEHIDIMCKIQDSLQSKYGCGVEIS